MLVFVFWLLNFPEIFVADEQSEVGYIRFVLICYLLCLKYLLLLILGFKPNWPYGFQTPLARPIGLQTPLAWCNTNLCYLGENAAQSIVYHFLPGYVPR